MTKGHLGGVNVHAPFFIMLIAAMAAIAAYADEASLTVVSKGTSVSFTKVTPVAPFRVQASGPSTLVLIFRQRTAPPGSPGTPAGPSAAMALSVFMDGRKLGSYSLDLPRDPGAVCAGEKDFIPSVARTVRLKVPPGNHTYEVSMTGLGGAIRAETIPVPSLPTPSPARGVGQGPQTPFKGEVSQQRVFSLLSSLSLGYDSNILQLSPSDIDLFRSYRGYAPSGSLPRFASDVKSIDDFPITLELAGSAQGRPWGGRRTLAEMKGHAFFYPRNIIKWHGNAGFAFEQEFSPGPDIRVSYVYQTPTYLRNLSYFDPQVAGTSFSFITYRKAWFQAHTGEVSLVQNLTKVVSLDAGYAFGALSFRDVFKERDSYIHKGMGGIRIRPWKALGIKLGYAYERSLVRGDIPSTPRIESDASYSQSSLLTVCDIDLDRLGIPGLSLNGDWGLGFKNFATGNASDIIHYHRQDVINSAGGKILYHITREWALGLSYSYTLVNSNAKPTAVLEESDEATSYREDTALLTVAFTSPSFGPSIKGGQ